jgi:PAS domain S-box-containing protein
VLKCDLPSWWSKPSVMSRYLVAVLALAVGIVAVDFFLTVMNTEPFVSVFTCTIMFVAWFCGFGPALFATAVSIVALHFYILGPVNVFAVQSDWFTIHIGELPRIVLFAITALFVNFLSAAQRAAAESLRRSRDELQRSEAFLAEGQRISHTGSWGWNISSGKLVWSAEHCRIFGVDPQQAELTFPLFQTRVHPKDRAVVQRTLDQAILEKRGFSLDYRIILPDGTTRFVRAEARPVISPAGGIDDFIGTTMDITERKQSEELLRNAQVELARVSRLTMIGELAASIAHEINQPLGAMVANANACLRWLAKVPPQLDEARGAAERIVRDGHRAGDIIKSVRALAGTAAPAMTALDINEVIGAVLILIRGELHEHRVALETDLADGLPLIAGDRVQLQQVILNLVVNAIEAMSADGSGPRVLRVRSQGDGPDGVVISVEDSGPGLAPETSDRLFEAFFTTKPAGMGMGLAICRSILNAHGGRLGVSQASPRGAVFHVRIPAAAGRPPGAAWPDQGNKPGIGGLVASGEGRDSRA